MDKDFLFVYIKQWVIDLFWQNLDTKNTDTASAKYPFYAGFFASKNSRKPHTNQKFTFTWASSNHAVLFWVIPSAFFMWGWMCGLVHPYINGANDAKAYQSFDSDPGQETFSTLDARLLEQCRV